MTLPPGVKPWDERTKAEKEQAVIDLITRNAAPLPAVTRPPATTTGRPRTVDERLRIGATQLRRQAENLPDDASPVQRERLRRRLSRAALGALANLDPKTIRAIELGLPTTWNSRRSVAKALGLPPRRLGLTASG